VRSLIGAARLTAARREAPVGSSGFLTQFREGILRRSELSSTPFRSEWAAGRAADVRGVLTRRQESETRRVLQAVFAERIAFAPFNEGATRGYQFVGNGSYGQLLLGDTCPTSGRGPNGIRLLVGHRGFQISDCPPP